MEWHFRQMAVLLSPLLVTRSDGCGTRARELNCAAFKAFPTPPTQWQYPLTIALYLLAAPTRTRACGPPASGLKRGALKDLRGRSMHWHFRQMAVCYS